MSSMLTDTENANVAAYPWNTPDNSAYVAISQDTMEHLDRHIIKVTVSPTEAVYETTSVAHFRIFLVLRDEKKGNSEQSIEVDSVGIDSEGATKLYVMYRPCESPNSAYVLTKRDVPIVSPFTVKEALCMLLHNGRHKYQVDAVSGSGHRYWVYTVLGDFVASNWIAHGGDDMIEVMEQDIRKEDPDIYLPDLTPKGRFF